MTKKDYKKLAAVFKARRESIVKDTQGMSKEIYDAKMQELTATIKAMVSMLEDDNPRFDKNIFFIACGMGGSMTFRDEP